MSKGSSKSLPFKITLGKFLEKPDSCWVSSSVVFISKINTSKDEMFEILTLQDAFADYARNYTELASNSLNTGTYDILKAVCHSVDSDCSYSQQFKDDMKAILDMDIWIQHSSDQRIFHRDWKCVLRQIRNVPQLLNVNDLANLRDEMLSIPEKPRITVPGRYLKLIWL